MFKKSGFNNNTKMNRDELLKMVANKSQTDSNWLSLITNVVDICFNECKFSLMSKIHAANWLESNLINHLNR